jgi:glycine C-acetyltransferase
MKALYFKVGSAMKDIQCYYETIQTIVDYDKYTILERDNYYYKIRTQHEQTLDVVGFVLNDVLNLSQQPDIMAVSQAAVQRYGTGSSSSTALAGKLSLYDDLVKATCHFKEFDYGTLFINAWMAFRALFEVLCYQTIPYRHSFPKANVTIFNDINNHSCIHSAINAAKALYSLPFSNRGCILKVVRCDIRKLDYLAKQIKSADSIHTKLIFIADAVYSMDGTILPLPKILNLFRDWGDVTLILDSAHATGTVGSSGRGILEHFGLTHDDFYQAGIDLVELTTYSKFAASTGAIVMSHQAALHQLLEISMYYMNTASLTPGALASALAVITQLGKTPAWVVELQEKTAYLRRILETEGFFILGTTHIIPVIVSPLQTTTQRFSRLLLEKFKLWIPAIYHVATPRLRIVVNRLHTRKELRTLVEAMVAIRDLI